MDLAFTDDQEELRRAARRFLATASTPARVREAMKTDRGWEASVWERIGQELGWPALLVPEAYGGAGAGYVELVGILEETGRSLLCAPLFATAALGTNALLLGTSEEARALYLPQIAAGEMTATLAHAEAARFDEAETIATARVVDGGFVIDGAKRFVVDGHTASLLIVVARAEGKAGRDGIALFAVPADSAGVERRRTPALDMTRALADVTLRGVQVPASAMIAEPGAGWNVLQKTLDRARIALAAEQVGGAQRCLEMAVDYAKVRTQFGRPIGSFQAIKHKCADIFVDVESARSAAYYAACVAAGDAADELAVAAATAKAYCSEAYFRSAAETIQIHGGIGFTWEHDAHLYFKRAKASEALLGDPDAHRDAIAHELGLA